jgi:hypothetical protein
MLLFDIIEDGLIGWEREEANDVLVRRWRFAHDFSRVG